MDGRRRWRVHGRVQGVSFRAATRAKALSLGISGCARNLPDGTVEVVAAGPVAALDALGDWLWEGPPAARVSDVELEAEGDAIVVAAHGFTIA